MNSKKTVIKNTGILYVRMLITLLVSLYTSRVTLEMLGIDDFGVYGVIGGVVGLFAFLSRTLTASFNRYICIGIAHNDQVEINHVVGASMMIQLIIIAVVLIVGETVGIWFINDYLVIAPEKLTAAHVVFQFSVVTFIVNIFTSAYNSIIISYERMSIYAYICIFEVIAKLAVVYALSLSDGSRLELYAGYICGVQLIVLVIYYWYVRKQYPMIRAALKNSAKYVKDMLSFAGYGFVGSFAFVVKNQGLNFLLNIFGGPALNAARAISFQVYTAVYNFVGNFQTAFSPYLLKRQTLNSKETCNTDVRIFTQVSFAVMVILMIPILYATPQIIQFWLGDNVPEYTISFTRLILLIGLCEAISAPLLNIINGSGNIARLQITAFVVYLSVIVISYLFLKKGALPNAVYYIDLASNIFMVFMRIIIARYTTDLILSKYFKTTFLPIVLIVGLLAIVYALPICLKVNIFYCIIMGEAVILLYAYLAIPKAVRVQIVNKIGECIKTK